MAQLPIIMGPQGPIPQTPASLRQRLVDLVSRTNPDYTVNLPGSLIEDICSTDVGALIISNQFMIDLVNSISPYAANLFILNQLGTNVYGIQVGTPVNTSVDVVFLGTPGFVIIQGFIVSDGTYQYICNDGGVIGTDGNSLPLHAVATVAGTWAVPSGSVTGLVTSVPQNIELSVVNPSDGIPSLASETATSFRTRTLTAGLAATTGTDRYLKTLLWNIPGVVQRLVSVRQDFASGKWFIIVGGGDPYQVAWAIYYSGIALPIIAMPTINIVSITSTSPVVVTTEFNHNLVDGLQYTINDVLGMIELNGNKYFVHVITPKTFSLYNSCIPGNPNDIPPLPPTFSDPVDGTTLLAYISGGIVTPNPILQEVSLNSYPDTYLIPFILPPQQLVTINIIWNTNSPNYVSQSAIAQSGGPAIVDYINNLYVGVSPINIFDMTKIFLDAIANILASEYVTALVFEVFFDGKAQSPELNTGVIYGDPNSYFYTTVSKVIVTPGL